MQALTGPPREHLTDAEVTGLLTGTNMQIWPGLELLRASDLAVVEDVSTALIGGSLTRTMARIPHGSCTLQLDRAFVWGVDLLRPYMIISDPNTERSARWNLGVYTLTTPEIEYGETPVDYSVSGWDRVHLLNREIGDTYSIPANTQYLTAIRQAFVDAGLAGVLLAGDAGTKALPTDQVWPLIPGGKDGKADQAGTTTWLRVVNDLLSAINYRAVWADQDGLFRGEPYVAPSSRTIEWSFSTADPRTTIADKRRVVSDVWKTPNRWVFVRTNLPDVHTSPAEGAGIYTVNNVSNGPTSQNSRGLIWSKTHEYEVASQEELVALGDRRVAADLRDTERFIVSTAPFPPAGHFDVFTFTDAEATGGVDRRVQAAEWSYSLAGSDVSWQWEAVS